VQDSESVDSFLPAVGGGALQVAEHDIEDVDYIVGALAASRWV
jgi:hypothetical protein